MGSGTRAGLLSTGIRSLSDLNAVTTCSTLSLQAPEIFDDIDSGRFEMVWSLLEKALHGGHVPSREEKSFLTSLTRQKRLHHTSFWLRKRRRLLLRSMKSDVDESRWFVKEPNLHMITPAVLDIRDDVRMVMVVRHGVDMAFSESTAAHSGITDSTKSEMVSEEVTSLRYCAPCMKESARGIGSIRILSYDRSVRIRSQCSDHCSNSPASTRLDLIKSCSEGVRPPKSIGRRHEDLPFSPPTWISSVSSWKRSSVRMKR